MKVEAFVSSLDAKKPVLTLMQKKQFVRYENKISIFYLYLLHSYSLFPRRKHLPCIRKTIRVNLNTNLLLHTILKNLMEHPALSSKRMIN